MTEKVRLEGRLTKREILLFEDITGMSIEVMPRLITDPDAPKMKAAAALTLIAVKRRLPATTLDEILDGDYQLEWEPTAQEVAADPLPPPDASTG